MTCPECGHKGKISTIDSRPRDWGTKRIRKCTKCGFKFATIEIYDITKEAIDSLKESQYLIDCRSNTDRRLNNET